MDSRYRIKVATNEDINDLVRMRFALQKHMSLSNPFLWELSPKRLSDQPDFYRKMMGNEAIRLLVAYDSEKAINVGMGFGWKLSHDEFVPDKSGRIEDIWIDPEHRRKGVCKALLLNLIKFFAADGINSLVLQYVEGNTEAEQTWTKLGFHSVLKSANASLSDVEEKCKSLET